MDIFEFAMKFEKDGESYYREIASKTGDKGLATIMNMLADEEEHHYQIVSEMKRRTPALPPTGILKNVKNVFEKNAGDKSYFNPDKAQVELYKHAQELEKQSEDFYKAKAGEVKEAAQKDVLMRLAEEEHRHYFILEHIIQFVSRPEHWLADREFTNLDKY